MTCLFALFAVVASAYNPFNSKMPRHAFFRAQFAISCLAPSVCFHLLLLSHLRTGRSLANGCSLAGRPLWIRGQEGVARFSRADFANQHFEKQYRIALTTASSDKFIYAFQLIWAFVSLVHHRKTCVSRLPFDMDGLIAVPRMSGVTAVFATWLHLSWAVFFLHLTSRSNFFSFYMFSSFFFLFYWNSLRSACFVRAL